MRVLIIGVVVVAILAILAFVLVNGSGNNSEENNSSESSTTNSETTTSEESPSTTETESNATASNVTITYTNDGFSPSSATLKTGGAITWVNSSNGELQIGVNPHPTHTSDKAITEGEYVLTVSQGQSKVVTISKAGTFGYHSHLFPDDRGSITVQ